MPKQIGYFVALLAMLLFVGRAFAVDVNPTGVNVRYTGPSTAFLTFRGLRSDQGAEEGLWCSRLAGDGSCLPGTILGRLPAKNNLSRTSGASNFTDIMTIPSSVTRRAYQSAKSGGPAVFFFVRRFSSTSGSPSEFVPVTCRMGAGGARTPLSLIDVKVMFEPDKPVLSVKRGDLLPPFRALVRYNGGGRLKGRWEIVLPGDDQPTARDLLPEASLPVEERGLQRRYTLIGRFDKFLPPTGKVIIPGPNPKKLPQRTDGLHRIILRIEASADDQAQSDTGSGIAFSGGVAGFSMPSLRYYVGGSRDAGIVLAKKVALVSPAADADVSSGAELKFKWAKLAGASHYKIIVEGEAEEGRLFSAFVKPTESSYTAPPWVHESAGVARKWKVAALNEKGSTIAESEWRSFGVGQ